MTTTQTTIALRYGARLLALVLAWGTSILGAAHAHFAALTDEGALVALAILIGLWVLHVVQSFADTGVLAPDPPAAPVVPVVVPPVPPAPEAVTATVTTTA